MKVFYVIIFMLFTSLVSCRNIQEKVISKMIDSVECNQNPGMFYAIYIPDSIITEKHYPVLYLFDAGGQAKKTVERYKNLADKYDIILTSSWSVKNGPYQANFEAASALLDDISIKYPVDPNQQIIAGFSGGSRIACSFARSRNEIRGVISIGAFNIPDNNTNFDPPKYTYSGICGTYDFNFREAIIMNYLLQNHRKPFQLINYDGEHDWPPDSIFERALVYQLSEIQNNLILKNQTILLEEKALKQSYENENLINASWILHNLSLLNTKYQQKIDQLYESSEFKGQAYRFDKSLRYEDSLRKEIDVAAQGILFSVKGQNIFYKPPEWWKTKIEFLQNNKENDLYKKNSRQRILSYIGIILWQINRQVYNEKHYTQALEAAEILCQAYPESSTYLALKAESLFLLTRRAEAKKTYKKALNAGFSLENEFLGKSPVILKLDKIISDKK